MISIEIFDKGTAHAIRQEIRDNGGYCPRQVEHTKDTKCICKDFKDMDNGVCMCKLYIKTATKENIDFPDNL